MRIIPLLVVAALASSAAAQETLPAFRFISAAQIAAVSRPAPVKAPAGAPADEVTAAAQLARGGKGMLYGTAATPEEAAAAQSAARALLAGAGIESGVGSWSEPGRFWTVAYTAPNGLEVRDYIADPRQFAPKDDAALLADMDAAAAKLKALGHPVIAKNVVRLDGMLPTWQLLYLTKPEVRGENEQRLRRLDTHGATLDQRALGWLVNVVSRPKPWLTVYIGPELGYDGVVGATAAERAAKLAEKKAELSASGRRLIGWLLNTPAPGEPFTAQIFFEN